MKVEVPLRGGHKYISILYKKLFSWFHTSLKSSITVSNIYSPFMNSLRSLDTENNSFLSINYVSFRLLPWRITLKSQWRNHHGWSTKIQIIVFQLLLVNTQFAAWNFSTCPRKFGSAKSKNAIIFAQSNRFQKIRQQITFQTYRVI